MCFVAQRFGWVKPAGARMAVLQFMEALRDFKSRFVRTTLNEGR